MTTKKKTAATDSAEAAEAGAREGATATRPVPELLDDLAGANRRMRQEASHELASVAREDPSQLVDAIPALIDALYRPEAQTRWEVLNALSELARSNARKLAKAYEGAEAALFDEASATVRLAAFRFLSCYGATSQKRSDEVWPLLDEAIQCFHGDSEYRDMLSHMLTFAHGRISKASREALAERIRFDATSGHGYIKTCSAEIFEVLEAKAK